MESFMNRIYLEICMYSYGKFYDQNALKRGKISVRQQSNKLFYLKDYRKIYANYLCSYLRDFRCFSRKA